MSYQYPWQDPDSKTNAPHKSKKCNVCGDAATQYWGPWCFSHNVERMTRINKSIAKIEDLLSRQGGKS